MNKTNIILIEEDRLDAKLFRCCADYYKYKTDVFLIKEDKTQLSKKQLSELEKKLREQKIKVIISDELWGQWRNLNKIAKKYNVPFILYTESSYMSGEAEKERVECFSKLLNTKTLFYKIKDLS